MVIPDKKKAYWHKSDFAFGPRIDFSIWMSMERFNAISKMHVFTTPDARAYAADKLYQLRAFVDAYNDNLTNVIVLPGKYLCVDESMNQWLGHGMPNLNKIPRKPHSIGQEYKTTADCNTCCIIRLDITGDEQPKKFDGVFPKTIATALRLVEPWFSSGRTVKKKRYWPRGMPVNDMVQSLDDAYGSAHIMKSLTDSVFIASLQDKKPKCVIANAGSTTPGASVNRWIDGRMHTFHRPLVFEEYEANKGAAVDTANKRRDNMPSFHDVMKTYRCWEMRCLSFFLAVAEANAFSAHKYVEVENGMNHFEF